MLVIRRRSTNKLKTVKRGMMYRKISSFTNSTPLIKRRRQSPISSPDVTPIKSTVGLGVTINRFTPSNRSARSNQLKLRCFNSPRFHTDYSNRTILGTGTYGDVYKGIKRIEGRVYNIMRPNFAGISPYSREIVIKIRVKNFKYFLVKSVVPQLISAAYSNLFKTLTKGIVYAVKISKKMMGKQSGAAIAREICAMASKFHLLVCPN